jgi:transcriptional regulator with XRE-family HTH domain
MPFRRARLAQLRALNVLTQRELAERAGVTLLSVHKIETGQQEPRPATIRKLARALGVKPTDLMEPDEELR